MFISCLFMQWGILSKKSGEPVVKNDCLPRGRKNHSLLNKILSLVQLLKLKTVPIMVTVT